MNRRENPARLSNVWKYFSGHLIFDPTVPKDESLQRLPIMPSRNVDTYGTTGSQIQSGLAGCEVYSRRFLETASVRM